MHYPAKLLMHLKTVMNICIDHIILSQVPNENVKSLVSPQMLGIAPCSLVDQVNIGSNLQKAGMNPYI